MNADAARKKGCLAVPRRVRGAVGRDRYHHGFHEPWQRLDLARITTNRATYHQARKAVCLMPNA
jgi:hypothetical protein